MLDNAKRKTLGKLFAGLDSPNKLDSAAAFEKIKVLLAAEKAKFVDVAQKVANSSGKLDDAKRQRLGKFLAMLDNPSIHEARNAFGMARKFLAGENLTWADVGSMVAEPAAGATTGDPFIYGSGSFFDDMDDKMEQKYPGWKAEKARKKTEKEHKDAKDRAEILKRYGSEEAARKPNEREQILIDATAHLVRHDTCKVGGRTHDMETLSGWSHWGDDMPDAVKAAVSAAYPLPTTVTEAAAEYHYWRKRDKELRLVNGFGGDFDLILPALARQQVVNPLFRTGIRSRTLAELELRMDDFRNSEAEMTIDQEQAILDDIRALRAAQDDGVQSRQATAAPGNSPAREHAASEPTSVQNGHLTTATQRRAEVERMIADPANAGLSDREIARRVGVAPMTVGNIRRRQEKRAGGREAGFQTELAEEIMERRRNVLHDLAK